MESVPIDHFIAQRYTHPSVQKIVESWRIEPKEIIDKLVDFFREMGIYEVHYGHERLIMDNMLRHLRFSPEITQLVSRARTDEIRRQRNRHAD